MARPTDAYVAAFLGGNRGQQLLSLRPADGVPCGELPREGVNGWTLDIDADARPVRWRAVDSGGAVAPVAVGVVGPEGSLRDLLDSALSSPARTAVRVNTDGALVGVVTWPVLEPHLAVPAPPQPAAMAAVQSR